MEELPTDILLHELGEWLYPFERFKLCGVSSTLANTFSIDHFKFNHNHYKYDCNYYTKYLQKYLHDGVCILSQNAMSELDKIQLQHLKYFIIFHHQLYKIYKTLSLHTSQSHKASSRHTLSSSSSKILSISARKDINHSQKRKSCNLLHHSYLNNPFLKALKHINIMDLSKCASSFAIKPYNMKFLCDILLCGFNVPSSTSKNESISPKMLKYKSLQNEAKSTKKQSDEALSLNLSANNLNSFDIGLICKAIMTRYKAFNISSLDLSINHNISDLCVRALFKCIGMKCHRLQSVDLSYANITDASADIIYNFYHKYFINKSNVLLHKIDLSFTRISENGLFTLDQLFNELPKSVIYIHNNKRQKKHTKRRNIKQIQKRISLIKNRRKSQSFEIVLKGCFFEPIACKNYNCLASIPKLQTHCCIEIKADSAEMSD